MAAAAVGGSRWAPTAERTAGREMGLRSANWGSHAEGTLRERPGDAVDLEADLALEVAHRCLGARPVDAVEGDRVAQRDERDLQRRHPRVLTARRNVRAVWHVRRITHRGEVRRGADRHAGCGQALSARGVERAEMQPIDPAGAVG